MLYDIDQMHKQFPDIKVNVENSTKFVFEYIKNTFKPFVIEGDAPTNFTKDIGTLYQTDCAANLAALTPA